MTICFCLLVIIFSLKHILKYNNNNFNKIDKKYLLYLIIYCLIYIIIIYNFLSGFTKKPAYKVSCLIQISIIITSSLLGYFIFNEKFSKYNIFGILLALLSMILIMC